MKTEKQTGWSKAAWVLVVLTLIGAFLRFYRINAQSFWGDEAISSLIATSSTSDVLNNARASTNPPGYYLLLHFWHPLAGSSDLAWRFPSALMGVLGICLVYQLGRSIRSKRVGLWAAAITTLAPFHVFYSQEARMYTQLHSLTCILMLSYLRLWQDGKRSWWVVFFLASVVGIWTHFFIGFVIAILAAHFALVKLRFEIFKSPSLKFLGAPTSSPRWVDYFLVNGAILVVFGLYLPRFVDQVKMVKSATWRSVPPSLSRLVGLPLAFTVSQFLRGLPQLMSSGLTTFLAIVVGLQVARALWQGPPRDRWLGLLCVFSLGAPGVTFLISRLWKPVFADRYLIVAMPAFYLLLAWGATHTRERRVNQFLLLILFLLMIWGLHNWYFDVSFAKPPIRDAVNHIQTSKLASAPVVHGTATSHRLFEHYAVDMDNRLLADSSMAQRAEDILKSKEKVIRPNAVPNSGFWYIFYPIHSLEFQLTQQDRFDIKFNQEYECNIDGIYLYYYADQDTSSNE
jgi:uncharacterized membrane protein